MAASTNPNDPTRTEQDIVAETLAKIETSWTGLMDAIEGIPDDKLRERGAEDRFTLEESVYQRAKVHPFVTTGVLLGGGLALAAFLGSRKSKTSESGEYKLDAGRNLTPNTSGRIREKIREKMEVVGSDGAHVGTIDHIESDRIKLTRKDSTDGRHHFIQTNLIESVAGEKVTLKQTAEEVRQSWQTDDKADDIISSFKAQT